jgi:signal transduction histidine kinase
MPAEQDGGGPGKLEWSSADWQTGPIEAMHALLGRILSFVFDRHGAKVSFAVDLQNPGGTAWVREAAGPLWRASVASPISVTRTALGNGICGVSIRSVALPIISGVLWRGALPEENASWLEDYLRAWALDRDTAYLIRTAEQVDRIRAAALEERASSLTSLVARISHDASTPLGIAKTALVELKEEIAPLTSGDGVEDPDFVGEVAALIARNVERAADLVGNFKSYTERQLRDDLIEVDIRECVEEILKTYELVARRRRLEVVLRSEAEDATWIGYPGHLAQVLLNLLTNAERYAYGEGGGRIDVVLGEAGDLLTLEVRDYGAGIEEEARKRVFEQSFTTGRERGGTGLGLAIVWSLVADSFGGTVVCDSSPGKGTSFLMTLPRRARPPRQQIIELKDESGDSGVRHFARLQSKLVQEGCLSDELVEELLRYQSKTASVLSTSYRSGRVREALRVPCDFPVAVRLDEGTAEGRAVNISAGGMRVHLSRQPQEDEIVVELQGAVKAALPASVVECRARDGGWSVGLHFESDGLELDSEGSPLRAYLVASLLSFWRGSPGDSTSD